jgi:hypothetical protein
MTAISLRWFLLGYFALLIVAMTIHSDETVGINATWVNGNYSYEGGAPPWSLAFGIVGAGLYLGLLFGQVHRSSRPLPHLFRRWVAGLIDFVLALIAPASILGLVAVLIEYKRTGVFDWVIDRQESQPGDFVLAFAGALALMFVVMPAYFATCWSLGRPTPGACILGYLVVTDEGVRLTFWRAALRAVLGSMALLAWPCWILAFAVKRDKSKGKFWLDIIFKTHAELLC